VERIRWIESNGKKILYSDYSGLNTTEELTAVLDGAVKMVKSSPTKVLSLVNFKNSKLNNEFMGKIKKAGEEVLDKGAEKTAVVGVTGLQSILYKAYVSVTGSKTIKVFDNEEDAIAFLIS
jgi:hypothetical protein